MPSEERVSRPYIDRPFFLGKNILNSSLGSDTFVRRLPKILCMSMDNRLKEWAKLEYPLEGAFPTILGFYPDTIVSRNSSVIDRFPFYSWYEEIKPESMHIMSIPEYESKVATQLVNYFIHNIKNTEYREENTSDLASQVVGIQLISTNLIDSPDYVKTYLSEKYGEQSLDSLHYPNYAHEILFNFKDMYYSQTISSNIRNLYLNHEKAYLDGFESSKKINKELLKAFFNILSNKKTYDGLVGMSEVEEDMGIRSLTQTKELLSKVKENPHQFFSGEDEEVQFVGRYLLGLEKVAEKIAEGKENGILYIYDHLMRIMENNHLIPQNPNKATAEKWKEPLLECLKDPSLFDFLKPEEKVREVLGRYDYRALIDYYKILGKKNISIISLGFGKLGAAAWEMEDYFKQNGITTDIVGVDKLPLGPITNKSEDLIISKFDRTKSGILADTNDDKMPDISTLPKEDVDKLLGWYSGLLEKGKLIGNLDLVNNSPDIKKADLVTLQGTVACLGNYSNRAKMITNALQLVKPDGGILLVEGGMTLTGGQNVNSIALRLNNGKVEIIYLEITRTKGMNEPSSFIASQKTLLINKDILPIDKKPIGGENYFSISFSDNKEIIPALFQAINNDQLESKNFLD